MIIQIPGTWVYGKNDNKTSSVGRVLVIIQLQNEI